jgi:hypothetical protein
MLQDVDPDTFYTLSVLPETPSNTTIRFDIYCSGRPRTNVLHEFKSQMHNYWARLEQTHTEEVQTERAYIRPGMHGPLQQCISINQFGREHP